MKLFSFFLNLMCMTNKKINTNNSHDRFNKFMQDYRLNNPKNSTGNDERPNIKIDNNEELLNIYTNIHKKKILETLIDSDINILHKIELINKFDILNHSIRVNISSGGLLDDFNFEF